MGPGLLPPLAQEQKGPHDRNGSTEKWNVDEAGDHGEVPTGSQQVNAGPRYSRVGLNV